MRPKTSVNSTKPTTTPTLSAKTAGRNWIFAIQLNQWWAVPVKSRNSRVISAKNTTARIVLIFLSIMYLFSLIYLVVFTIRMLSS